MSISERLWSLVLTALAVCILSYFFIPRLWRPIAEFFTALFLAILGLIKMLVVTAVLLALAAAVLWVLYSIIVELFRRRREFHERAQFSYDTAIRHRELFGEMQSEQRSLERKLSVMQEHLIAQKALIDQFKKILMPEQVHAKQLDSISREFVGETVPWNKLQDASSGHWNEPTEGDLVDEEISNAHPDEEPNYDDESSDFKHHGSEKDAW